MKIRYLTKIIIVSVSIFLLVSCIVNVRKSETILNNSAKEKFDLAQKYQSIGKLDSALIYFNLADSLQLNNSLILHERGLLNSSLKNYDAAIVDLTRSINLTCNERLRQVYVSNRGIVYFEMGDFDKACKDWRNSKYGKKYLKKYSNCR